MNPTTPAGGALSVLIVDPFRDAATSTAELLTLHGYTCRTAGCGEEALATAAMDPPDVVFTELRLGGLDGCGVARRLRGTSGRKRPLLIAVTSCGLEADRRRSSVEGFDLHLVKPVDPAVLVGLLKRFHRVLARPAKCTGNREGC